MAYGERRIKTCVFNSFQMCSAEPVSCIDPFFSSKLFAKATPDIALSKWIDPFAESTVLESSNPATFSVWAYDYRVRISIAPRLI